MSKERKYLLLVVAVTTSIAHDGALEDESQNIDVLIDMA